MEIAIGWPIGIALSLYVVFADILLMIGAARHKPHLIGPVAILAVLACLALLIAVSWTTRPMFDEQSTRPDDFFSSANWLYWFAGVPITSIAIQALFAIRYFRFLLRA